MTVVAQPDVLGALLGHLLTQTGLTAVVSTRIGGEFHDDWISANSKKPLKSIQFRHAGDINPNADTRIAHTRYDVRCYGANGLDCMTVWNILKPTLCPGSDGRNSFIRNGCRVNGVSHEGGPNRTEEPDVGWPVVVGSFVVEWCEVPHTHNSE